MSVKRLCLTRRTLVRRLAVNEASTGAASIAWLSTVAAAFGVLSALYGVLIAVQRYAPGLGGAKMFSVFPTFNDASSSLIWKEATGGAGRHSWIDADANG